MQSNSRQVDLRSLGDTQGEALAVGGRIILERRGEVGPGEGGLGAAPCAEVLRFHKPARSLET